MVTLSLPFPVSTNRLWRGTGRRIRLSDEYKAWKEEAGWFIQQQKIGAGTPVKGNFTYHIVLAESERKRREAMEKQVFEQYVEGVQTRIDTTTPPEMRWLVMFPKLTSSELRSLRDSYGALSSFKPWLQQWLAGDLTPTLAAMPTDAARPLVAAASPLAPGFRGPAGLVEEGGAAISLDAALASARRHFPDGELRLTLPFAAPGEAGRPRPSRMPPSSIALCAQGGRLMKRSVIGLVMLVSSLSGCAITASRPSDGDFLSEASA